MGGMGGRGSASSTYTRQTEADYLEYKKEIRADKLMALAAQHHFDLPPSMVEWENLDAIVYGLTEAADLFPEIETHITVTPVSGPKNNAYASTTGHVLNVSEGWFNGDKKTLENQYIDDLLSFWHPAGTTTKHITSHEYGHIVERYLGDKRYGYAWLVIEDPNGNFSVVPYLNADGSQNQADVTDWLGE